MRPQPLPRSLRLALALALVLPGLVPAAQAATQCDADPAAVLFEATVDPTTLNKLLSRLGDKPIRTPNLDLTLDGLCVDHRVPLDVALFSIPFADAPFTVTPSMGAIQVELELSGPFGVGLDGGRYRPVNCSSTCVVELPYIGEVFNGCAIEAGIVGPLLGLLDASISWDDIRVTQTADTCVLGDCTAVHPLESSRADLPGFDIDLTGFGSCEVCLDFPDPIPDPPCLDPCDGIDPLIEALVRPVLEDAVNGIFINRKGEGTLIEVFSRQIRFDFGCIPIPEVRECRQGRPVAGLAGGPRNHGLNALFYSLPLGLAGVLALRLRRRRTPKAPSP